MDKETKKNNMSTLTDYFSKQLVENKIDESATAFICETTGVQMTYAEVDSRSTKLAICLRHRLMQQHYGPDNDRTVALFDEKSPDFDYVIGIMMEPSIDLVIALLAILKYGLAYVPLGSGSGIPKSRINHIVDDCQPLGIICDKVSEVQFTSFKCPIWSFQKLWILAEEFLIDVEESGTPLHIQNGIQSSGHDTAVIIYTSGSTGVPKGVRISHRTIMNRLIWQWKRFPYLEGDTCCIKTTITFGDSVTEIFGPLLQGIPVVICSSHTTSQPDALIQTIWKHKITRLVLVPSLLKSILSTLELLPYYNKQHHIQTENACSLNSLKLWVCSGEALSAELLRKFFTWFPRNATICNFYGSTELTFDVAYEVFHSLSDINGKMNAEGNVPIGKDLWNAKTYILNESFEEVGIGKVGELYVGGEEVLAKGYVGYPVSDKFITIESLEKGKSIRVFRTGDHVQRSYSVSGDLNLYYIGRKDNQIKVSGRRVDLSEIEVALKNIKEVKDAVVLCYHPEAEDQKILGFVITQKSSASIQQELTLQLESYKMPTLIPVPKIPLLVCGKTDRQGLLDIFKQKRQENFLDLDWDLTKTVIQSISEVLHVPIQTILTNMNASFYSIGGTSLNTVLVILKLREKGIHISIPEFINMGTIMEIIRHVQKMKDQLNLMNSKNLGAKHSSVLKSQSDYIFEPLRPEFKEYLMELITFGESHKGDLEVLVGTKQEDVALWLSATYDFYVDIGLSFVVKRVSDQKIVASALNRGLTDTAPDFIPNKNHAYVFEILTYIDSSQKNSLPCAHDKIFRSGPINTSREIGQDENVILMTIVEEQNIQIAKKFGFHGILSTNLSPLTQQITRDLLEYNVLLDYQVNQFKSADGEMPFSNAPNEQRAICCFKSLIE